MVHGAAALVLDAAIFKPVTVFRDIALLWSVGLGSEADRYFSAIAVLVLLQAMAVGSMANAWIPQAANLTERELTGRIWKSLRDEFHAALLLTFGLMSVLLVALAMSPGGRIDSHLRTLIVLAPIGSLAYLQGWLGNYFYAGGATRKAQLIWAM